MRPLLAGFADELCKLAQPQTGALPGASFNPVRPPATAPLGTPQQPIRAPNAFGPTSMTSAIPRQVMSSPQAQQQQTWRPSPTYKPEASAAPAAAAGAGGGGHGGGRRGQNSSAGVAFESSGDALTRGIKERWSQGTMAAKNYQQQHPNPKPVQGSPAAAAAAPKPAQGSPSAATSTPKPVLGPPAQPQMSPSNFNVNPGRQIYKAPPTVRSAQTTASSTPTEGTPNPYHRI